MHPAAGRSTVVRKGAICKRRTRVVIITHPAAIRRSTVATECAICQYRTRGTIIHPAAGACTIVGERAIGQYRTRGTITHPVATIVGERAICDFWAGVGVIHS